jgi:hypothetical protein
LAYVDDVNLLGDNVNTIKKSTETVTNASREVGLEINVEKTKYTLLSCHQNAGQDHDIKTANRAFENVSQFKYLGTKVTNQNLTQEVMFPTIQFKTFYLLVCCLKTINIIYKTIILPVVLYRCDS